ncbi:hypothetical protein FRB99_007853 [Tulasnella sp. 403]|nr:hypothetical protein FRB99_007853 [Tulasnella sp. 403]
MRQYNATFGDVTSGVALVGSVTAFTALLIAYGYMFFSQPIGKYRTAGRIRTYLASKTLVNGVPFYSTAAAYSAQRAVNTFSTFGSLSKNRLDSHWNAYSKLSSSHKGLGDAVGYPNKLRRIDDANSFNDKFARRVARFARDELGISAKDVVDEERDVDLYRAQEALKHLVRDWSNEGRTEREAVFRPILQALGRTPEDDRAKLRVLVPGCGLGRLAWEISRQGFNVTANEYSHFMTLPLRYLLSDQTEAYQHRVQPYYFTLSHNREPNDLFRVAHFPDAVPRLSKSFRLLESDFYSITQGNYDFIVTLFFIDTSVNIAECLQQIHRLLKPGGTWINLGPLLWTSGSVARMELSLEEVLALANLVGFQVESRCRIDTEYTSNTKGMMRYG